MSEAGRWAGRNPDKDVVRNDVWRTLEADGVSVGPAWSMIPNFVGADVAAWHLAQTPEWAAIVAAKSSPTGPTYRPKLPSVRGTLPLCEHWAQNPHYAAAERQAPFAAGNKRHHTHAPLHRSRRARGDRLLGTQRFRSAAIRSEFIAERGQLDL